MITGRNVQNLSQNSINTNKIVSGRVTLGSVSQGPATIETALHPRQASMMTRQASIDQSASFQGERQNQNRFRKAQLQQSPMDVSSRYWNQIGMQINVGLGRDPRVQRKSALQTIDAKPDHAASLVKERPSMLKLAQQQLRTIDVDGKGEQPKTASLTPIVANIPRNEFDQLQRPFSFLANVGGKETSSHLFTANVDKNLLKNMKFRAYQGTSSLVMPSHKESMVSQQSAADPSTIDYVTFNQSKNIQEGARHQREKTELLNQTKPAQVTIFTDMNVDNHEFDIIQRRKAQRAISAMQRPQSSFRKNSMQALSSLGGAQKGGVPTSGAPLRPISGLPPALSAKTLPQAAAAADGRVSQKSLKNPSNEPQSRRPFSANPKYMKVERPTSSQMSKATYRNGIQDDDDADEGDDYVDLRMEELAAQRNGEVFSQRLMSSRPTTAYKKERKLDRLPFPELFDRSERTFAATFAKYGDLTYYTPVQRIGSYMDFSARLKRKHLTELIAYLRTSKKPIKPADEELNEPEQASKDFWESCLFIGVMPEEDNHRAVKNTLENFEKMDEIREVQLARERVFDQTQVKFEGAFQYEKVWSQALIEQVELSVHRFKSYLDSTDAIKNEEISKFNKDWMKHALDLIPDRLLGRYQLDVRRLFSEIFTSYARAMRQSILEYILRSPEERKRLHIVMLPRPVPTASERQAITGGYSTAAYAGCHQRKAEAENEIKLRLLTNSVVTSALQSWFRDFRAFNLLELRDLGQFIDGGATQDLGKAQYALDVDAFLNLQDVYRGKVLNVLRHIWYRGCLTIVKKFKFLRLKEDCQKQKGAHAKWTFSGYQARPFESSEGMQRQFLEEHKWEEADVFNHGSVLGEQSQIQAYFTRTASTHHNVPLIYFDIEPGFESNAILTEHHDMLDLNSLVDIRENSAYLAFVAMIGGYVNFEENGYDILTKEYKRELKYAAGNLMKHQMRALVDKAAQTLLNFFSGFPTFKRIMRTEKPMRQFRVFLTRDWVSSKTRVEEERRKRAEEEEKKQQPMSKYEEVAMKKRASNQIKSNEQKKYQNYWDAKAALRVPDFYDFQDLVHPVLRLDLTLVSSAQAQTLTQSAILQQSGAPSIQAGDALEFTKRDADIIEEFDGFVLATLGSLNDFVPRPEFAKVNVLSVKRYEGELEEEARLKKLNIKVKQTITENPKIMPLSARSGKSEIHNLTGYTNAQGLLNKAKSIETLLYNGSDDAGDDMYRKYLGRIQISESEKQRKDLLDDNNMGVFAKTFIEKYFRVADPANEDCYLQVRSKVRRVLSKHLKEAKRVVEFYEQVQPLIKGQLDKKVRDFVQEDRREHQYESILKELRWHEKIVLQLPSIVFFPMFEVSANAVKEELLRRAQSLIAQVFRKYEGTTASKAQTICDKYSQICRYLDKQLRTPQDVIEMDRFKNNLLLEIGNLQEKSRDIRDRALFLMKQDKVYEDDTWALVKQLHEWPDKMNAHMDACDERHHGERQNIENAVQKRKEIFDKNVEQLTENIQEVHQWADMQTYRLIINKVVDYQALIDQYDEKMAEISQEELMLFGFKSSYLDFENVRDFYQPHYEIWTLVSEVLLKKRKWLESPLHYIDADEVDTFIRQAVKQSQKLTKIFGQNTTALKVCQQVASEIAELNEEWLPTVRVLCNPYLQAQHWAQIQQTVNSNFNYRDISLNEVKYLGLKQHLPVLMLISDKATQEALKEHEMTEHDANQPESKEEESARSEEDDEEDLDLDAEDEDHADQGEVESSQVESLRQEEEEKLDLDQI